MPKRESKGVKPRRPKQEAKGIKLRRLEIKNYKLFDSLTLEFPAPRMKDDPDVIVMGSKNGLGKTSVLECCALLFLGAAAGKRVDELRSFPEWPVDPRRLLIRAGASEFLIQGLFHCNSREKRIQFRLCKSGPIETKGSIEAFASVLGQHVPRVEELAEQFAFTLMGLVPDPFIVLPLLYFHSYRKVREGNAGFASVFNGDGTYRRYSYGSENMYPMSMFKMEVVRLMMGRASLVPDLEPVNSQVALDELNSLVERYVGGRIERMDILQGGQLDLQVTPSRGGTPFTFDSLSSGQKEIISTLFLIWRYTRDRPGIVLIDEPELHLNAEWHRDFIQQLHRLAPQNQYIIATHSEDVFASVEKDRCLLLLGPKGAR